MMMNDNLADMVKSSTPSTPPDVVDLEDVVEEEIDEEVTEEETKDDNLINITSLLSWFENNETMFENLKPVKVKIQDGDPNNLILSVQNLEGRKNDDKKIMRIILGFENAHKIPFLNLQAIAMNIFKNNNFRVLYPTNIEDIFVKCYSVNNGLITIFCSHHGDLLIPYVIKRIKRKDKNIEIITNENKDNLDTILSQDADLEAIQLLYKQSVKVVDKLSDNKSVIEWLLGRQKDILDINHLLQIDNLIIEIMKG